MNPLNPPREKNREPGGGHVWLPDELTNRGLRVAADPPRRTDEIPVITPAYPLAGPVPGDEPPGEAPATVARPDLNGGDGDRDGGGVDGGNGRERAVRHESAPIGRPSPLRLPDTVAEFELKLREAERRVAQATRATEQRVAELHTLVRDAGHSSGGGNGRSEE